MIKKKISRTTFQEHLIDFVRDEMYEAAIKDDGIYSTFKLHNRYFTTGETRITLYYYKWEKYSSWEPVHKKIFYINCPELGDVALPFVAESALKRASDRIRMDAIKNDDAIWSTIKIEARHDYFLVKYAQASNLKAEASLAELRNKVYAEAGIKAAEGPMTAQEMEIENTKEDLKASLKTWKTKAEAIEKEGKWKSWEPALKYAEADVKATKEAFEFIHKKEEKEKKDMNVTLMVVPNGMNKDFVNKVKANFQSNNSTRLFVASTDIDYSGEYEEYKPLKNKYDLFEDWVKRGKVDIVYFMLGFEKDPDVKAFESFVRGITEAEVPGKVDVRVVYQKDDILNDVNNLRNAYFDEADAEEDLERAGNRVVREAKVLKEVYSLNNTGLDIIKYSKGKIDASDELVINDIMDTAFASDEDTKPAKKGGKK